MSNVEHLFMCLLAICIKGTLFLSKITQLLGFPGGAMVKNLPASAGDLRDLGSIPGLERSPEEGHDNPLLENPMDRGALRAPVHGSQSWI